MIGSKTSTARIMGVKFKLDPNKNYQLEYLINKAIEIKNDRIFILSFLIFIGIPFTLLIFF